MPKDLIGNADDKECIFGSFCTSLYVSLCFHFGPFLRCFMTPFKANVKRFDTQSELN